jgi:nicotinate-nucleotide pyrophosphorylase (carboxylating)
MEMAMGKVKIEISGGVNLENLEEIASLKPDRISVGAITKSAKPIDMSLEVVEVLET